jgi:Tfp pilus assembly protein FimT
MLKKILKNKWGLTLIELLPVNVLLEVITALAVPEIGNITTQNAISSAETK